MHLILQSLAVPDFSWSTEPYSMVQKATDLSWNKFLKAIYSIFKFLPARTEDYLKFNDLLESHQSKDTSYLYVQKICGHTWLKNRKDLKKALQIYFSVKAYFMQLKEKESIPSKNYCFKGCVHYIFAHSFLSLNDSPCQTRKNVFYFTSKALFVLEKINFRIFNFQISWRHQ